MTLDSLYPELFFIGTWICYLLTESKNSPSIKLVITFLKDPLTNTGSVSSFIEQKKIAFLADFLQSFYQHSC